MSVRRADLRQTRRDFIQTALLAPSVLSILGNSLCFAEDIKPGVTEPSVEETLAAIKAMNATSATNVTPERLAACDTIRSQAIPVPMCSSARVWRCATPHGHA